MTPSSFPEGLVVTVPVVTVPVVTVLVVQANPWRRKATGGCHGPVGRGAWGVTAKGSGVSSWGDANTSE